MAAFTCKFFVVYVTNYILAIYQNLWYIYTKKWYLTHYEAWQKISSKIN